jgi:hypothetical protein
MTWTVRFARIAGRFVVAGAVALTAYLLWIRPWHLRWGATSQEVALAMPGDEIVKYPTFNATRAITIEARPEERYGLG